MWPAWSSAGWCCAGSAQRPPSGRSRRARRESTTSSLYVALGVVLGGRLGYVLFYDLALISRTRSRSSQVWHRRHVLPWRPPRRRSLAIDPVRARAQGIPAARVSSTSSAAVAPIGLFFGPHRQLHQWRALGPADRRALGDGLPERRAAAAPSEPALRGRSRRHLCSSSCWSLAWRPRPPPAAACSAACSCIGYALARIVGEFFREPDAQLGYLSAGWLTMGMLLSLPMLAGRRSAAAGLRRPRRPRLATR